MKQKQPSPGQFTLTLSPIVRLGMAFSEDIKRDSSGRLLALKDQYLQTLATAEQKRDKLFQSFFLLDAVLLFLISGQEFVVPGLGIQTGSIPAVTEALTIATSLSLVFLIVQFVTYNAYSALIRQIVNQLAQTVPTETGTPNYQFDPEFLSAAQSYEELSLKVFRQKLNLAGPDYYVPRKSFTIVSRVLMALIAILFVLFPLGHIIIVFLSLKTTFLQYGFSSLALIYYCIVVFLHILAILIAFIAFWKFEFEVDFLKPPWNRLSQE